MKRKNPARHGLLALATCLLLVLAPPRPQGSEIDGRSAAARKFLATIAPDAALQEFLDETLNRLMSGDGRARRAKLRVALIELEPNRAPRLAHRNGETPIYPASVVKFVYLMAAYAWAQRGELRIEGALDRQLTAMIYNSSNTATQQVFRRLTRTEPGPALSGEAYARFHRNRHSVKRWLQDLGVTGIHSIHPTYNGGGDLFGRDVQLLKDSSESGGIGDASGTFSNRQAMTALGTARLLALLASDLALGPDSSAEVRRRMRRDPARQPYQRNRIAGGALETPGVEVSSKSGTWGPIFADAGIIRGAAGRQLVLAVFIASEPAYRGSFIADLARACTSVLLGGRDRR